MPTTTSTATLPRDLRGPRREQALEDVAHAWGTYLEHSADAVRNGEGKRIGLDRQFVFSVLLERAKLRDGIDHDVACRAISAWITPAFIDRARKRAVSLERLLRRSGEFDLGPEADVMAERAA